MKRTKIGLVVLFACGVWLLALADRGGFVKRNKTHLNIAVKGNFKKFNCI